MKKTAQRYVLGFMITQKCCITSEKKPLYSNFRIFQENLNNMFSLSNFDLIYALIR